MPATKEKGWSFLTIAFANTKHHVAAWNSVAARLGAGQGCKARPWRSVALKTAVPPAHLSVTEADRRERVPAYRSALLRQSVNSLASITFSNPTHVQAPPAAGRVISAKEAPASQRQPHAYRQGLRFVREKEIATRNLDGSCR